MDSCGHLIFSARDCSLVFLKEAKQITFTMLSYSTYTFIRADPTNVDPIVKVKSSEYHAALKSQSDIPLLNSIEQCFLKYAEMLFRMLYRMDIGSLVNQTMVESVVGRWFIGVDDRTLVDIKTSTLRTMKKIYDADELKHSLMDTFLRVAYEAEDVQTLRQTITTMITSILHIVQFSMCFSEAIPRCVSPTGIDRGLFVSGMCVDEEETRMFMGKPIALRRTSYMLCTVQAEIVSFHISDNQNTIQMSVRKLGMLSSRIQMSSSTFARAQDDTLIGLILLDCMHIIFSATKATSGTLNSVNMPVVEVSEELLVIRTRLSQIVNRQQDTIKRPFAEETHYCWSPGIIDEVMNVVRMIGAFLTPMVLQASNVMLYRSFLEVVEEVAETGTVYKGVYPPIDEVDIRKTALEAIHAYFAMRTNICAKLPSAADLKHMHSRVVDGIFDSIVGENLGSDGSLKFLTALRQFFERGDTVIASLFWEKATFQVSALMETTELGRSIATRDTLHNQFQNNYLALSKYIAEVASRELNLAGSNGAIVGELARLLTVVRLSSPSLHFELSMIGTLQSFNCESMQAIDGCIADGEGCRLALPPILAVRTEPHSILNVVVKGVAIALRDYDHVQPMIPLPFTCSQIH